MYSFVPIQGNRVLASVIVYNHYKRNALEFTCIIYTIVTVVYCSTVTIVQLYKF